MVALAALVPACGAPRGWVSLHPEVAAEARRRPGLFVERAARQWDGVDSLWGSYRLAARRGLARRSADLLVLARRPGQLQVEVLAPTGATQVLLVAGEQEVGLWVAEERRLYRGPAGPEAFGRALGVGLSAAAAVGVLLGYGAGETRSGASWQESEQRVLVRWERGATALLHPLALRYEEMRFPGSGAEVRVALGEWAAEPAPVPGRIRIELPREGLRLELEARQLRLNPEVVGDPFRLPRPRGTEELPLELLAREGGLLRRALPR